MRLAVILCICALAAPAQKYSGPKPPKPDTPYLLHADNLVETEISEAKEQANKDDILYVIPGANSPVGTPLAAPIFLLQAEKLDPNQIQLYRLESREGRRQVLFRKKGKGSARPIRMEVSRLTGNIYRIEVDESLDPGEYSLTPEGSNQVFCFQVR